MEPAAVGQEKAPAPPRELSEEEKRKIINSDEFCQFFDRTSRVIERALAEDVRSYGFFFKDAWLHFSLSVSVDIGV